MFILNAIAWPASKYTSFFGPSFSYVPIVAVFASPLLLLSFGSNWSINTAPSVTVSPSNVLASNNIFLTDVNIALDSPAIL